MYYWPVGVIILGVAVYFVSLLGRYVSVKNVVFRGRGSRNVVALTIDDAPYLSASTNEILDVLKQFNVKCTFFCIGENAQRSLGVVKRIRQEGHEIANHHLTDEWSVKFSDQDFLERLRKTESILETPSKLFRPGSGFFTSNMVRWLKECNYQLVLGSLYPHDAHIPSSWHTSWFVRTFVRNEDIIILHDRHWTARALGEILQDFRERNIRVVTVSELLQK